FRTQPPGRPRAGRYRHQPFGHPARGLERQPRGLSALQNPTPSKPPASRGRFRFYGRLPPPMPRPSLPAMTVKPVHVVGGGLAGSEAAWQLAQVGIPVVLHEMRPLVATDAHKTDGYAELVCSNSFRSDDAEHNAVGLLHEEMRRLGSLIMRCGDANQVPAGGALAVDRDGFASAVTAAIEANPLITICREEVGAPPDGWDSVIVATGPLTSPALADFVRSLTAETQLAFFDAI